MNKRAFTILAVFLLSAAMLFAQSGQNFRQEGLDAYSKGQWQNAVLYLRRSLSLEKDAVKQAETLYWISLSEIALRDYEGALKDLKTLTDIDPVGKYSNEAMYQRGRIYYYQGNYEQAITVLKSYVDIAGETSSQAAGSYWIAESLFSLGRFSEARSMFSLINDKWPSSAKYEAAAYRIALIDQKTIEQELLTLLKWTHEESLKTFEDYQRRERSYEQALIVYQKRIAEMLKDTRLADLENENKKLKQRASLLEQQLAEIQNRYNDYSPQVDIDDTEIVQSSLPLGPTDGAPSVDGDDILSRLEALRLQAIKVQEALMKKIELEGYGD